MNLPIEYCNYIADGGAMEAFLSEQPLYMALWPIDDIGQFNAEYEVPKYAPGFLCFGTNGGGELLAFDSEGAIFCLPAIGMEPKYATLVASSWPELTRLIVPAESKMETILLDEVEFKSTFGMPMRDVVGEASNVIDIWPYVSEVPPSDLQGHEIRNQFVEHVYRSPDNKYDHVMVMTKTQNVYLVVVVHLLKDAIYGHHLLDLNSEYGLS